MKPFFRIHVCLWHSVCSLLIIAFFCYLAYTKATSSGRLPIGRNKPTMLDSEHTTMASMCIYSGIREKVEGHYIRDQNICEYTVWVPLNVLFGGDYPVVKRCETIHRWFMTDVADMRIDMASEAPAYWFRVWGVSDSAWLEQGKMTSGDVALTIIVFNGRLFSQGNMYPNSRAFSALAQSKCLRDGGLEVSLDLSRHTLRIGETFRVAIRVRNTSGKRIVFPHVFGNPIRLAHQNVTAGFSEAVSDEHKGGCIATHATILMPGCDFVIDRDVVIRGRFDDVDSSVLRSDAGACLLTVLDMEYYGIPTSSTPVSFTIEPDKGSP